MTLAAIFAIIVGTLMVVQWTLTILRRDVRGPEAGYAAGRGPVEMGFHWAAEFATAMALMAGGLGLLAGWAWAFPVYLVATGMLIYTVINSPGYFAEQRQWAPVAMFGLILVVALVSLALVLVA
jgi:hypothetical protein